MDSHNVELMQKFDNQQEWQSKDKHFQNERTRLDSKGLMDSRENTRGVAEYSDFGAIECYISETVQDRS